MNKVKKNVVIDERAEKVLGTFPAVLQEKFQALFEVLRAEGFLKEPYAKRINKDIFEVRVQYRGEWRSLYAYAQKDKIIILTIFNKKTQKTPRKEIRKAEKRLRNYI